MIPKNQFTSQPQFPVKIVQSKPFARGLIRCGLSWSKIDLVTGALLTQSDLIPSIGNASARKGGTASPFTYAAADVVDFINLTEYTIVSAFVPKTNSAGQNNGVFRTGATSAGAELFLFSTTNYPLIRVNGVDILAPTTGPTIPTDVLLVAGARVVEGTSGTADVWWSGEQKHSSTFNRAFSADDLYNIGYQTNVATGNTRELQAYWFWDRKLTDAEMVAVTQNPWQLFSPVNSAKQSIFIEVFKPSSDVTVTGWSGSPDNVNLYANIDEPSASDTDYILSPSVSSSPGPAIFGLSPSSLATGNYTVNLRARRTGSVGQVRALLVNSSGTTVGTSSWQTLTTTYTTYNLAITTTGTAARLRFEVQE